MKYIDRKQEAFEQAMQEAKDQEDAKRIYREIWERFSDNRKRGKSFAYSNMLHDVSKYASFLVPKFMSHKDLMGWQAECEANVKNEGATNTQEDAREVISSWLRGDRELSRIPFERIQ